MNPNTLMLGPVFIFTDHAIVPPPKQNGEKAPSDDEEKNPDPPPADEPGKP